MTTTSAAMTPYISRRPRASRGPTSSSSEPTATCATPLAGWGSPWPASLVGEADRKRRAHRVAARHRHRAAGPAASRDRRSGARTRRRRAPRPSAGGGVERPLLEGADLEALHRRGGGRENPRARKAGPGEGRGGPHEHDLERGEGELHVGVLRDDRQAPRDVAATI